MAQNRSGILRVRYRKIRKRVSGSVPNYRNTMFKLQMALCLAGENVSVDEKRFYSIPYKKMLTKYIVKRQHPGEPKETIIETYRVVDVVKALAELYNATGGVQNGS